MANIVDLAVIGAGPGGYVAAIRAAQAGMKVAIVDKRANAGGTCLNVGCIPTKTLLHATELVSSHMKQANKFTVAQAPAAADFAKMQKNKDATVKQLATGINFLFKKNKIEPHLGVAATLTAPDHVKLANGKSFKAKNIIIATGSRPATLPMLPIDEKNILSSDGLLALQRPPKHLLIVGGGVIGLEFATVFNRLGTKVEVIEFLPKIAGSLDNQLSAQLQKSLEKQGIKFHLSTGVTGYKDGAGKVVLTAKKNEKQDVTFEGDKVLVSVGRKPETANLGLETLGVKMDKIGRLVVDEQYNTCVSPIKAIGDCIPGPMLAHKAEEDGVAAVNCILGKPEKVRYCHVPAVVYTEPECASVGSSEEDLKLKKRKYKSASFPLMANSRSRCNGDTEGFVKVLMDTETGKILGACIMGQGAGEMIHEFVIAIKFGITAEQLGATVHAHPTVSEAIKEACMAVSGKAVHV